MMLMHMIKSHGAFEPEFECFPLLPLLFDYSKLAGFERGMLGLSQLPTLIVGHSGMVISRG